MTQNLLRQTYKSAAAPVAANPNFDRDALIGAHLPKVKFIADRMAAKLPPSVERDDLYGAGIIGLIDAVERFDFSRGVQFTTFAEMRVRGAILDSLRALDWASRAARKRAKTVQAAFAELEQTHKRAATEIEVAAHLNITIETLRETLNDLRALTVTDVDDETDDARGIEAIVCGKNSPLEEYEENEKRRLLTEAIENLPARERQVVALYYVEELTMREIGAVLSITESRVSQIRSQAIVRLRAKLAGANKKVIANKKSQ